MSRFDVAMFGAGRIGAVHARNVAEHPGSRLKYVVDPVDAAARALAERNGARAAPEDAVWSDPEVAAIVVGSATSAHAELIEKGVRAGKAVFCEKPIDLSLARVDAVLKVVEACGRPLFMAFNRRFDPGILEMKRRIVAGDVGDVELVTVVSKDPDGGLPIEYLKTSGGMFRDMTIHDFDMARYLAGDIAAVQAVGANLVDPAIGALGDIDTCAITLRARSGALVQINNSRRSVYGYDQRLEVFGAGGMLQAGNRCATTVEASSAAHTAARDPVLDFFIERYTEAYRAELDAFVAAVEAGRPVSPDFADGVAALELAVAAG
ncbi:MAG: inositol 2-dehydrogenase, partial [Hyphomicrobiales bacterium]|nr:inositol 2-dehydrogenase [Hyphomicrobiales bacterium]